jgi:hypothetical protein
MALFALALVVAAAAGYFHGVKYEAGQEAEREVIARDQAAKLTAHNIEQDKKLAAQAQKTLDDERAAREKDRQAFEEELKNAPRGTLVEKSCKNQPAGGATDSGPVPQPGATGSAEADDDRITAAAVRLWNDALSAGATVEERAGWLDAANAGSGSVDLRSALRNLKQNAGLLGECRTREALIQQGLCSMGLAQCPK